MCYINIHLTVNSLSLNKYCIVMQIIIHDCYTLSEKNIVQQGIFRYNFYRFVDVYVHTHNQLKV